MKPYSGLVRSMEEGDAKNSPKVSIGLPVYNGERYLSEAIESVRSQEFTDFELLISDNASTDSTWEICRHYARMDRRIRLHRNDHNIGAIANFDLVLRKSTGRYFAWTAHDDLLHPKFLARCVHFLDNHTDHVVCSVRNVVIAYETGQESHSPLIDQTWDSDDLVQRYEKCVNNSWWPIAIYGVMRREVLERITLPTTWAGDVMFVRELCLEGKFHQINEELRYYRGAKLQPDLARNKSTNWPEALYGPGKRREFFPWVRAYAELIRRLSRKPLPPRIKANIVYLTIARFASSNFRLLYWDLVGLVRDLTYSYPPLYRRLRSLRFRIEPRHWRSKHTADRE